MTATLRKAGGYQGDAMNLPVADLATALPFYLDVLGFQVLSRSETPHKSAVLARDQVQIGLVENGADPAQDGCWFHVANLQALLDELNAARPGEAVSKVSTEKRDDGPWNVFYVVAPDGLCYWFGEHQ